ncbi:MAG: YetF domain-containing protein [Caldimonas sp.]
MLSKDTSLVQGLVGMLMLIGLQFAITWLSVRVSWVRKVVTGEPQMLVYKGSFVPHALRNARVTEAEVLAAVRASGINALGGVQAVVLETDASFSVIGSGHEAAGSSLIDVRGRPGPG